MPIPPIPGGAIAKRELHFIYLIDCSASMKIGDKMQSLNHAIRESIPHMRNAANTNVHAEMLVRSIRFASGASWHQSTPTPVEQYDWKDLKADDGSTDMAGALVLAKTALQKMARRQFPPVLCLISDGMPDSVSEYRKRLAELKDDPWGSRAIRIAIGIGAEASDPPGLTVLQEFMGNIELPVLTADHAQDLAKMIRFVSTEVPNSASSPPSVTNKSPPGDAPSNAVIPPPPPTNTKKPANDPNNLPW